MKRFISALLALMLMLCLTGCRKSGAFGTSIDKPVFPDEVLNETA